MLDFDTRCDRCGYAHGAHKTMQLGWTRFMDKEIKFWQQGLCPDSHNMQQPSWDMYLFQYVVDGKLTFPYEDEARKYRR